MAAGPRTVVGGVLITALLMACRWLVAPHLRLPRLQGWATVFVAICVQALPFLVFGAAVSAAIASFVP
ncbi:MAG TPA: permease, partial [Actinoallomurus sp.]|nr:permease [Actinoallomurus sp.]